MNKIFAGRDRHFISLRHRAPSSKQKEMVTESENGAISGYPIRQCLYSTPRSSRAANGQASPITEKSARKSHI